MDLSKKQTLGPEISTKEMKRRLKYHHQVLKPHWEMRLKVKISIMIFLVQSFLLRHFFCIYHALIGPGVNCGGHRADSCSECPQDGPTWHGYVKGLTTFTKGRMALPNQMNFRKSSKGGEGSFSIQKFTLQILGTLNRAFLAWNWFKRVISGFRVCFFNNCIERNQNKTHISGNNVHAFHTIWPSYLLAYMQPYPL